MRTAGCDSPAEAVGEEPVTLFGRCETRGPWAVPRRLRSKSRMGWMVGLVVLGVLHTLLARSPVEIPFWHRTATNAAAGPPAGSDVQGAVGAAQEGFALQTFNLCFGMAGDAQTLEAVLESDADVLVLQESTDRWRMLIEEAMVGTHPHQFWRAPAAPYAASGAAILSRFPLRERRAVPSAVGWFESLLAIVDTPHGSVQVVGVHLQPAAKLTDLLSLGRAHEREIAHAYPETDLPVIVAGDFNEERGGAVAWLRRQGLAEGSSGAPTWRWPVGPIMARLRIDHIFVSSTLTVSHTEVLPQGRSDHLPVRAVLRFVSPSS